GSSAAVGCPAVHVPEVGSQSGLTSATLNRLSILKPSAMTCSFTRSLREKAFATRRSIWKKPGRVKALRPSVPVQPKGGDGTVGKGPNAVPVASTQRVGTMNSTPLMKGDVTAPGKGAPAGSTDGRFVAVPKSRFGFEPIRTLYGRPEATSMTGATVKSAKRFLTNPLPEGEGRL